MANQKDSANKTIPEELEADLLKVEKNVEKAERGVRDAFELLSERALFGARWLLLPLYLGLAASLFFVVYKFVSTFYETVRDLPEMDLHGATLEVLQLLDITLLGNLVVIIIFSGYENFVSKINVAQSSVDRPAWMGKVDYSGLKIKLIGSLVAISVIELLHDFMNAENIDGEVEKWRIGIHLTFVISGVLFALMDFIADRRTAFELDVERKDLELEKLRYEIELFRREHRDEQYRRHESASAAD
ncbi:MAG: hypothetical protein EBS36_03760 [Actinobacteria bacterium]|nr:hypothetical protein [Actinomycetota bacterium]NBY15671.1 hypothetical protein [Actinomycetota bacterium]